MTIYFVMLAISMFFAVYAQRTKPFPQIHSSFVTFGVLTALPFIIITVFRYQVGTDYTYIYESGFVLLQHGVESFPDQGFSLIFRFFGLFTDDAWWAISFVGLLTMIFFFTAICQQSVQIPMSIAVFFFAGIFFEALNSIRQALAMSMFVYSIKYLKARDWKRYFLLNLIGMAMHQTAILYFPLYFLYGVRATPRRCLAVLGIAILGYPVLGILVRVLGNVVPRLSRYIGTVLDGSDFSLRQFVTVFFFMLLHVFYLARYPQEDKEFEWYTYMMILASCLLLYSAEFVGALRAAQVTSIAQVFSFPMMLKKETDDRMRALVGAGILGLLAVRLLVFEIYLSQLFEAVPWYGVIPYKWVFFR